MSSQDAQKKQTATEGLKHSYHLKLSNGLDIGQSYADLEKRGVPVGFEYQVCDRLLAQEFAKQMGNYESAVQAVPFIEGQQDKDRLYKGLELIKPVVTQDPVPNQPDFLDWLKKNPKATVARIKDQGYGSEFSQYKTLSAAKNAAGIEPAKKAKK